MQTAAVRRYQNQLQDICTRIIDEMRRRGEAVPEQVQSPGELSHVPTHAADRDSEGIDIEVSLGNSEGEILNQVDAALRRIEQDTFGRCQDCGCKLSQDRLDAIPYAPYCLACEEKHERES